MSQPAPIWIIYHSILVILGIFYSTKVLMLWGKRPKSEVCILIQAFRIQCKCFFQEFGNQSDRILQSRALKRTNYPHASPKLKRARPDYYFHSLPQKQVYETLPTVLRLLGSEVKCQVKNLGGNHRLLQLRVGRTLSVFIILRGLNIEKVFARGIFEDDPTEGRSTTTEAEE